MRAALYLRISLDQSGEHLGVTRQQEDCVELAATLGWDVVETYVDNDVSATSGKPRKAYQAMLTAIEAGDIDAIVAWHPDRLYRKVADLGPLVEICVRNNTQIATARAGKVDLGTPTGRFVAGMLAQIATYEGEVKSDRWKRSIRQKREAGVPPTWGPRLFGYTREGLIVDAEAAVIRDVARQVIDGQSVIGITRRLNHNGHRTTAGNEWRVGPVRRLLMNPRLAGHSTLSRGSLVTVKDASGTCRQVTRYETDIVGVGQWEPILDADTFEQVNAVLAARSGQVARARVSLLPGLIFCGKCGTPMVRSSRTRTRGTPGQKVYRCGRVVGGPDGCGGVSIDAERTEEIVRGFVEDRSSADSVAARAAELRGSTSDVLPEVNALNLRISELEAQLGVPGIPVGAILRARDRLKQRLEELSAKLVATSVPSTLPRTATEWPIELEKRQAIVAFIVKRVDILPTSSGAPRVFDQHRVQITER